MTFLPQSNLERAKEKLELELQRANETRHRLGQMDHVVVDPSKADGIGDDVTSTKVITLAPAPPPPPAPPMAPPPPPGTGSTVWLLGLFSHESRGILSRVLSANLKIFHGIA